MSRNALIGVILGAFAALVAGSAMFIVDQRQQALVLRFGRLVRVEQAPGLKFKAPFIDEVVRYDARVLSLDPPATEVTLLDKKRLLVDAFVRYRISDPAVFYQKLGTEEVARQRVGAFLSRALFDILGTVNLTDLLIDPVRGAERSKPDLRRQTMDRLRDSLAALTADYGLKIEGVRIRRTDLPRETSEAVYRSMVAERNKVAETTRANGERIFTTTKAEAESLQRLVIAKAEAAAQQVRADADAKAAAAYAEAYGKDPEFYAFYRSLEAYRKGLGEGGEVTLVLSPDDPLLRFLRSPEGK